VSKFWQSLHNALGTKLSLKSLDRWSTRADCSDHGRYAVYMCPFLEGQLGGHLALGEFAYNNSYNTTIKMSPYEGYDRVC
jgi:hypothetical protein